MLVLAFLLPGLCYSDPNLLGICVLTTSLGATVLRLFLLLCFVVLVVFFSQVKVL